MREFRLMIAAFVTAVLAGAAAEGEERAGGLGRVQSFAYVLQAEHLGKTRGEAIA
ncbi:MAG: hypothetical protein HKN82_04685, partial [Akkermansiaceae bacterium]|nr:hypothetical protein [Akkermansiaceae bacterium]